MPDLIFNSENAAASQDRGGLPGAEAATHFPNPAIPVRPVLHASRGVSVSAIHVPVDRAFRQAPTCHHPRRPGPSGRAPHR